MAVVLKSRLPQIAAELSPRLAAAVKQGAETVAEAAKLRVPVDTGRLRDAIHVHKTRRAAEYEVVGGNDEAFYGHFVEFGTVKTSPRPFMVPALEEHRDQIIAYSRASLERL